MESQRHESLLTSKNQDKGDEVTHARFCLIYRHETTEEPSNNSGFFPTVSFQLMPPGTPCRKKSGLCDLPEHCTGESPFCPLNSYQIDGAPCDGGKAYCYSGMCLTYRDQCVQLWGPGKDTACSKICCPLNKKMFYSCCSSPCCARQECFPRLLSAAESEEPFLLLFPHGGGSKKISHAPTIPRKRTSEWLAWGELKQPLESVPCRGTASTRCLL